MLDKSEIRFLPLGDRRLAYELRGEGPPLVVPAWWVSHLELNWRDRAFRSFWDSIGAGRALVHYDGPTVGMSDRDGQPQERTRNYQSGFLNRLATVLQQGAAPISYTDQLPVVFRGDVLVVLLHFTAARSTREARRGQSTRRGRD